MNVVRAFRVEDIPQVARLWLRVFRRRECEAPRALQDYFRRIFFESPWTHPALPSLVCEERGRGTVGFLGVMPRRMTFDGQPVSAAVATQLMVEPGSRYAAARLMRTFLSGGQDLSLSDGSNEMSERLWCACGGKVAALNSLQWTRILRPAQRARLRLRERGGAACGVLAGALRPVCAVLDGLAARALPASRRPAVVPDLHVDEDPADGTLLSCVRRFTGSRALKPEYDSDSWQWLLQRAAEKTMFGPLRRTVAREPGGEIVGWYLYYLHPGGIAQVLQFGSRPAAAPRVLNSLFARALRHGAVAVTGGVDPLFTRDYARSRCEFSWPGYSTLVHSRHPDLLDAIHRGDALLSRLEAEWWARFSDPEWSAIAAARGARRRGSAETRNVLGMGTP